MLPSLVRLRKVNARNWKVLRDDPLSEISGALGDLGTLLPLLIALTLRKAISLPATLVFGGLASIVTGAVFGIPLPVQPMKVIAAIVIPPHYYWNVEETAATGFIMGLAVAVLAASGLLTRFSRLVPIPIIKGIQVGTGLSLVLSAASQQFQALYWWPDQNQYDSGLLALVAALFLVRTSQYISRFPSALVLFLAGVVLLLLQPAGRYIGINPPDVWHPKLYFPFWRFDGSLAVNAATAQLPLTVLNSIIAVTHLSSDLFPDVAPPTVNGLASSIAAMNLIGCSFGAMPVCHGSGGLAAQYRFGARSGASVMLLGLVKLILGLFFGRTALSVLERFPHAILGVMVLAAGLELAKVGESLNTDARDLYPAEVPAGGSDDVDPLLDGPAREPRPVDEQERRRRWAVMLGTVAGLLAFHNAAVGLFAGLCMHLSYRYPPETSEPEPTEGRERARWWPTWRKLSGGPDLIGQLQDEEERVVAGTNGAASGDGGNGAAEPYHD